MPRYVGSLHKLNDQNANFGAFEVEAPNKEAGVNRLCQLALEEMDRTALAGAALTMMEDGRGIGSITLENQKYVCRT